MMYVFDLRGMNYRSQLRSFILKMMNVIAQTGNREMDA
jgi:hypothetical protein